MDNHW